MLNAGMPADAVVAAIASMEEHQPVPDDGLKRSAHAIRQARYRDRKASLKASQASQSDGVTSRDVTVTPPSSPPSPFPDKEPSPRPPKEINPSPLPPHQPFSFSAGDEFDRFWEVYPNKVGKAEARKKFVIALRKIPIGQMLEALTRYANKTDDRPWLNPTTWLHQERWGDQPAQVARGSPKPVTAGDIFGEISRRLREEPDDEQSADIRDHGFVEADFRVLSASAKR